MKAAEIGESPNIQADFFHSLTPTYCGSLILKLSLGKAVFSATSLLAHKSHDPCHMNGAV